MSLIKKLNLHVDQVPDFSEPRPHEHEVLCFLWENEKEHYWKSCKTIYHEKGLNFDLFFKTRSLDLVKFFDYKLTPGMFEHKESHTAIHTYLDNTQAVRILHIVQEEANGKDGKRIYDMPEWDILITDMHMHDLQNTFIEVVDKRIVDSDLLLNYEKGVKECSKIDGNVHYFMFISEYEYMYQEELGKMPKKYKFFT